MSKGLDAVGVQEARRGAGRTKSSRDGGEERRRNLMRVGLVGCGKRKRTEKSLVKDLYTSPLFRKRRWYVERTCYRWYVLSAKHGLLDPLAEIEPYGLRLSDEPYASAGPGVRKWHRRSSGNLEPSRM